MSDATGADTIRATIRPHEAAHFGAQAQEWWDPKGSSAMLHKLNPVRLGFVRRAIDRHWSSDTRSCTPFAGGKDWTRWPLAGKRALDVGCGAGLLCEPLARLGANVTGVDAAAESIAVAQSHAARMGFQQPISVGATPTGAGSLRYLAGELSALSLGQFDLVTSMEVLEHVADKPAFVAQLAGHLAPGGLLILSTPNRTPASRALLVGAAEAMGMVPRGTHDWHDFVTPEELAALLAAAGLGLVETRGIAFSPAKGLHLSSDLSLDLIVAATRS